MNTCKTCKWWKLPPDKDEDGDKPYWGGEEIVQPTGPDYEPLKTEFEVRYCKHPKLLFCERPLEPNTFAVADGSTYMANLFTAQNFGCVLHEPSLTREDKI